MPEKTVLEVEGVVTSIANTRFRVQIEKPAVNAHVAGKMRRISFELSLEIKSKLNFLLTI